MSSGRFRPDIPGRTEFDLKPTSVDPSLPPSFLAVSGAGRAPASSAGQLATSGPALGPAELAAVAEVFASGYLGMGEEVRQFEAELAAFLGGGREVVATSSGTSAMHLACAVAGLGPGDEVLVPALTFVASFQAIAATGARPVACDILPRSGLLDLADAERRRTPRTRAVLPVHYAGYAGNLDEILDYARRHGLRVIEDAAHAFGSRRAGRLVGSFGDLTCFSFDPIKNITCGEGGAVVTREAETARRLRAMRRLGIEARPADPAADPCDPAAFGYDVAGPGWRYHLPNLLAAIGRVQLRRFETELRPHRLALADLYRSQLDGVPGVTLLDTEPGVVPHLFALRVPAARREPLREHLRQAGFGTLVQYPPAHRFTRFRSASLPEAERWFRESFTLPLHHGVSPAAVREIGGIIRTHFSPSR